MTRIAPLANDQADVATAATLKAVAGKLGMVPNLFATFARAPAALNGYLALSDALNAGRLNVKQRGAIALTVAQANACQYCLSAHTMMGKSAGLSDAAMLDARAAKASSTLENAIAVLAGKITEQRGVLSDAELASAREAGLDDGQIIEIVANVALNILTNYTNHIAATEIDFPVVETRLA